MARTTSAKHRIFQLLARVGKGLANGVRLEIIEILAQGDRTVEALAQAMDVPVANVSHHLQVLRESGLVHAQRQGTHAVYSLADEEVVRVMTGLRVIGERHVAEIERVAREQFSNRDGLEPVRREDLLRKAEAGEAMVIDVRPREEFAAGHVPGAINIPANELSDHLDELPQDREIVAYCRGPYCMLAYDAVLELREAGYEARRLEEGWPEWRLRYHDDDVDPGRS